MAEISKILGIDFGQSKVGLATADFETKIAFALSAIKNDIHVFESIKEICEREEIEKIVIGIPSHKMNPEGVENVEKFSQRLFKETKIEIEFENEIFTTKMAQDNLSQKGKKGISKIDDAESARIILQSWLDRNM